MAIWIVATVIAGFSSSRGNGDAVPYSLSCPMMSLNALGSNSDIPAKEYYFADSEDEREGDGVRRPRIGRRGRAPRHHDALPAGNVLRGRVSWGAAFWYPRSV